MWKCRVFFPLQWNPMDSSLSFLVQYFYLWKVITCHETFPIISTNDLKLPGAFSQVLFYMGQSQKMSIESISNQHPSKYENSWSNIMMSLERYSIPGDAYDRSLISNKTLWRELQYQRTPLCKSGRTMKEFGVFEPHIHGTKYLLSIRELYFYAMEAEWS